ncbi:hypothetical protein F5Y16DRAFT_353741 [Xylariaceae sp. FL0255]|nr:hypothetical protein F5Y16DRAFT_353741 [Xylariaceae sp. FL0255]
MQRQAQLIFVPLLLLLLGGPYHLESSQLQPPLCLLPSTAFFSVYKTQVPETKRKRRKRERLGERVHSHSIPFRPPNYCHKPPVVIVTNDCALCVLCARNLFE